jgi:demethylmenaquinone methyltransferase/2-methoxy-6-polyprenyl-1,4-benzoquinol methylase
MSTSFEQMVSFGDQFVTPAEKTRKVGEVFSRVSATYDLMNDAMTLGWHRIWKKIAIDYAQVCRGDRVLDLAAGTGDLTHQLCRAVGDQGLVVMSDLNFDMLTEGANRLYDRGHVRPLRLCLANAEALPFPEDYFDRITLAFGLRNMTDKDQALRECYRVLGPGGRLVVLEFSTPYLTSLAELYDWYSLTLIPRMGAWIANDRASYQYLVESIRQHPDQDQLADRFQSAGFDAVGYANLMAGVVAIHWGVKW